MASYPSAMSFCSRPAVWAAACVGGPILRHVNALRSGPQHRRSLGGSVAQRVERPFAPTVRTGGPQIETGRYHLFVLCALLFAGCCAASVQTNIRVHEPVVTGNGTGIHIFNSSCFDVGEDGSLQILCEGYYTVDGKNIIVANEGEDVLLQKDFSDKSFIEWEFSSKNSTTEFIVQYYSKGGPTVYKNYEGRIDFNITINSLLLRNVSIYDNGTYKTSAALNTQQVVYYDLFVLQRNIIHYGINQTDDSAPTHVCQTHIFLISISLSINVIFAVLIMGLCHFAFRHIRMLKQTNKTENLL